MVKEAVDVVSDAFGLPASLMLVALGREHSFCLHEAAHAAERR